MSFARVATFVPTLETTRVGMGFASVATFVPGQELAWVLHGCNLCAMSKVGMGFACVATSVPL